MASVFTRIIRRELPAQIVYEDEHTIAFLDLHPKAPGHTLVVPKVEVADWHALPPESAAHLAQALQTVAGAVTRAMGTPHYNLRLNNGAAAGQVVFHVHFHILPRYAGQTGPLSAGGPTPEGAGEIAAAIRAALAEAEPLFE